MPRQQLERTKGEHDTIQIAMEDQPLTPQELTQLRHNLAKLSEAGVAEAYRQAYRDCEMKSHRLPKPVAIQQLVQAWRQLWSWRAKERRRP